MTLPIPKENRVIKYLSETPAMKARDQGRGVIFILITVYLFLDLIRPSFVWHFPKLISVILIVAWVLKKEKVSSPQIWAFLVFVGILALDIGIAVNTYDAVWTTQGMFVLLIGICVPLINFTDTLVKIRHLVNALLMIFSIIAVYAVMNSGYGPARAMGGQDENYVAAAMNVAIPLAGFSFFAEKSVWKKVWFAGLVCLYILAIVIGLSRGGFVGLVCAIGYIVMKSPRKQMAIIVIVLIAGLLALVAGPSYWEEMATITDPNEGTADLRLEFWKIAFQEFLAYPLTGVGGDNYRWQMENFQSLEQTQKFDRVLSSHVHSTYFQLLSELGLAGCITFGFIMFRTYQDYRYIDRLTSQPLTDTNKVEDNVLQEDAVWIRNYGRGLIGALLGYMVSVAFLSALYYSHLWIIVSLVIALRAIASRQLGSSSIKESNLAQSGNIFRVPCPVATRS